MRRAEISQGLKVRASELGFSLVGIIEAKPGRRLNAYHNWLAHGYHGEMAYMARPDRQARRNNVEIILPGVQSFVCVGLDYASLELPEAIRNDPSRGRISAYAWAKDYHAIMEPRLVELSEWLIEKAGGRVNHKIFVDTGAILERDHAETAGLGFTGKNTMLIHPKMGSWIFLGELLTTITLTPDEMNVNMPSCGICTRCLTACPTKAFPKPYILDARRCISYLTIELKDWIPVEFRPLMGNWIYGCDICQVVCPFNRFSLPCHEASFWPDSVDNAMPKLVDLLSLSQEEFASHFESSPIKRLKRERFIRNVCVAAGNWADASIVEPLARLLNDPAAIIRGHAAWALGQIEGFRVGHLLDQALNHETDARVRKEIAQARRGLR